MMNVNKLIAEGKLNEAANALYDSLLFLINAKAPGVNLTRSEFDQVAPVLVAKMQDPASIVGGGTASIASTKGKLTVHFVGPEDDPDFRAPRDASKLYNNGAMYTFVVPNVVGYVPDQNEITGIMSEGGVEATVNYTKIVVNDLGFGVVEGITAGAKINAEDPEHTLINYDSGTITWSPKDASAGRSRDGWWFGIKVTAPEGMTTEEQFDGVTYKTKGSSGWSGDKSFWNAQDSNKNEADTPRYLTMWGVVDPEILATAIKDGKDVMYAWTFNWDADGEYEQLVTLTITPNDIVLVKDGETVWPVQPDDEQTNTPQTAILNITYISDDADFIAPEAVTEDVAVGQKYSVNSPVVDGYTASPKTVKGTMGEDGVSVTVNYTKNPTVTDPEEITGNNE